MNNEKPYYAKGMYKIYPAMEIMKPTSFLCTYREYQDGYNPKNAITVSLGFTGFPQEKIYPISGLRDIGVMMQEGILIREELSNLRHLTAHIPPEEIIRMVEKLMIQKVG